jgi:hypothetical protein
MEDAAQRMREERTRPAMQSLRGPAMETLKKEMLQMKMLETEMLETEMPAAERLERMIQQGPVNRRRDVTESLFGETSRGSSLIQS